MTIHECPTLPYDLRIEKGNISHIWKPDWKKPDAVKSINSSQMGKGVATPDSPINKGEYKIPQSPLSAVSPPIKSADERRVSFADAEEEGDYEDSGENGDSEDDYMTEEELWEEVMKLCEHPDLSKITQNKVKKHLTEKEFIPMGYIIEYTEYLVENLLNKKTFKKSLANTLEFFKELEEEIEEKNVVNII